MAGQHYFDIKPDPYTVRWLNLVRLSQRLPGWTKSEIENMTPAERAAVIAILTADAKLTPRKS